MPRKLSDKELMKVLNIDHSTLKRFRQIQRETIAEAKRLASRKGRIRVLGISGSARDLYDTAQEESNSEEILKRCLKRCKELGAETEMIKLRDYSIKHCKACYSTVNTQCHFYCSCYPRGTPAGDDMSNILYDKVLWADVLILATPVNNFKMSTPMAAFIDRCISLDGSLQPANPKKTKDKELNIKHMKFIELTADNNVPGSGMLRRFMGKVAGVITTGHEEGAAMVISSLFMAFSHFGALFTPFGNMYAMSTITKPTFEDKKTVLDEYFMKETEMLAENLITAAKLVRKIKTTDWKHDYASN